MVFLSLQSPLALLIKQHKTQRVDSILQEDLFGSSSPIVALTMDPSSSSPCNYEHSGPCPFSSPHDDNLGWLIALRKGIRSTQNPHPIYNVVNYHRLSPSYFAFVSSLYFIRIPRNIQEALDHSGWR